MFGILPLLAAGRISWAKVNFRWEIWLLLNAGILALIFGIPSNHQRLILLGSGLVFAATVWKLWQLNMIQSERFAADYNRPFYFIGLGYLLLGIVVGAGIRLGWSAALKILVPLEVHIHANNWGFLSLVFAGILIDNYPAWTGKPIVPPGARKAILWMMSFGALGLVLGPWFQSLFFTVPGLLMHITATVWLLLSGVKAAQLSPTIWQKPGIWHLLTAYIWILLPVFIAPLILLKVPGFPGAGIEQNAPQALIYGWVFQFGIAVIPYFVQRLLQPEQPAQLGGSWLGLILIHLGAVFLWASIFAGSWQPFLHGSAYLLWAVAIVPIAYQAVQMALQTTRSER